MQDRPTVLFVDDQPALADGHAAQLTDHCETLTAYDGESALEVLDEDVDVVFLDRRMPGLDGGSVLEAIRERDHDFRVVMLTGVEPDADVVEMGYDEYLVKPVDGEALRDTVERLLAESAAADVEAAVLDALGDPKTRQCYYALVGETHSADGLAAATGYSLTTVYRRLNALRQADLITSQIQIDPGGDHYETFTAAPTRIEIRVTDGDGIDVVQHDEKAV